MGENGRKTAAGPGSRAWDLTVGGQGPLEGGVGRGGRDRTGEQRQEKLRRGGDHFDRFPPARLAVFNPVRWSRISGGRAGLSDTEACVAGCR